MEFRLKMLCRKYYKIPPNQHLWEGGRSQVLGSFSSLPVSMVLWLRQFLPNQEGSYLYFLAAGKMKYIRQWPPVAGDRYQNSWWGGRIGWQRIFRARSKSTSQKKLMIYIYIDTFEWYTLIYYDILKRLWSCTINYWTRTCRSTPSRVLVVSASHLGSINFTWVLNFKALSTTNVGHVLPSLDVHPSQQVVHNHGYFEELQLPGHKRDV